jgi:hypothetical protein
VKRKLKVDLNELDVALNWGVSETEYYLDLETGKVVFIDDDTRWTLRGLVEEVDAERGSFLAAFEKMLEQREDVPEWQKEVVIDAVRVEYDEADRYLPIERAEPYQDYNDMDDFIGTVHDEDLQERLWDAIRGRGAFSRFKRLVARYPSVQEQWYAFKDARAEERLLEWLEDKGIELIE